LPKTGKNYYYCPSGLKKKILFVYFLSDVEGAGFVVEAKIVHVAGGGGGFA